MAKGFKTGGTGNILNFRVVGGMSALLSPKENTIWVNTAQKITSWIFSKEEPTEYADGMVWFPIGGNNHIAFNSMRKNGIILSPIGAKQYLSGEYTDKTAKIYQNGEWNDFTSYLFHNGDEFISITGGWVAEIYDNDASRISATKTISGDVMQFVTVGDPWRVGTLKTKNAIDLTPYDTLYFDIPYDLYDHTEAVHEVGVFESGSILFASTPITMNTAGIYSVDVRDIVGSYRVGILIMNRGEDTTNKVYVASVWRE